MHDLVALTGAGISVASGLPTFAEASWRGRDVRSILTKSYFLRNPEEFYEYFWEGLWPWTKAEPNEAHYALAVARAAVITQNIDGLHQKAGSREAIELHGNLRELICERCGCLQPVADWLSVKGVPRCSRDGTLLKPRVVLFEEQPLAWEESMEAAVQSKLFLVIGTSLEVAPACYLPSLASRAGAEVVIINESADRLVPSLLKKRGYIKG